MSPIPMPVWPVVVLAVIQLADAVLCVKPVQFIRDCYRAVGWPTHLWWLMPPIKVSAAAGLVGGIWIPWIGLAAVFALIAYFAIAVMMHIRARDFGTNLFVNATGMLAICIATLVISFVA